MSKPITFNLSVISTQIGVKLGRTPRNNCDFKCFEFNQCLEPNDELPMRSHAINCLQPVLHYLPDSERRQQLFGILPKSKLQVLHKHVADSSFPVFVLVGCDSIPYQDARMNHKISDDYSFLHVVRMLRYVWSLGPGDED